MKFKKLLLPFIAGALALSLAACGDDKKTEVSEKEMQAKLEEQQVGKDKIVAVVNEEELTGEEYNAVLMSIHGQMQQNGQDPTSEEATEFVKKQALDTLVNQTLILQKADEAEITASANEIDEEYALFEEQFGGEKEMKKALKSQNMDIDTLKEKIAESIIFGKYESKIAPAEEVTDKEIKEYYDQIVEQSKESGQELPPLEEASEEIKAIIEQEQQQKLLGEHVEELKEKAKIELKI